MKRKIVVEIDCKEETCGPCINGTWVGGCFAFPGVKKKKGGGWLRLPECKKAEVK